MGNITFLGVEGSGKSVLTMALVKTFKAHERTGWSLRPETREAFRFLTLLPEQLEGESLPHQTTSLRRLAWSACYGGKPQRTCDILDYPGEIYRLAFLDEVDNQDPVSFSERIAANQEELDAFLGHLTQSDQVFVLFNLADAENLETTPSNLDAVWVTNACLDFLFRLHTHPKVTLLLTQIDRYISPDTVELDPRAFVAQHLPLIAGNYPNLDVIAVSAIGTADTTIGMDNLMLRCLVDTPVVQQAIAACRQTRKAFVSYLRDFCSSLGSVTFQGLVAAPKACRAATDALRLHWFLEAPGESDDGLATTDDECDFAETLCKTLHPTIAESRTPAAIPAIDKTVEALRALTAPTSRSAGWKQDAITALLKTKQAILAERHSRRVWAMLSALGGVAAIAAWAAVWVLA